MPEQITKTEQEWREALSPEQYEVLRNKSTERPFTGKYVHVKDDGVYRCAACGAELFDSDTKFESRYGMAELHRPQGRREHQARDRFEPRDGPDRGRLRPLRRSSRPRFRRRTRPQRQALLHQLLRPRPRPQIASPRCAFGACMGSHGDLEAFLPLRVSHGCARLHQGR